MKQVLQSGNGATVVRDVPAPACPPGNVLVRNAFSVISPGTERARVAEASKSLAARARHRPDLVREVVKRARREGLQATHASIQRKLREETAVGYSSAGWVLEVGEAVRGFVPGEAVACAGAGHANHAEIVSVPANLCARVPAGVPLESAAFTTIAAIALHGIRLADVTLGDRVAVIGCGLVGQIACRLLKAAGAEVFAMDIDATRVEAAAHSGADHALLSDALVKDRVLSLTGEVGVDRVLVTAASSSNAPFVLGAEIARDRGTVVVVGDVPVDGPRGPLYLKELTVRVSRSYGPGRYDDEYEERGLDYPIGYVRWTQQRNMQAVLELQARGEVSFSDLVDEVMPVEDAERAYTRLMIASEQRPLGGLLISYGEPVAPTTPIEIASPIVSEGASRTGSATTRVGLIGPGAFACNVLVPAFVAAGAELLVVAGGSGPSAEKAGRNLGFTRVANSEEDVLRDSEVDAVVIATRHASHAMLACRALDAGKSVFCEKPLVLTVDELERVLTAAAGSRGILAVGFNRRFSPMLTRAAGFLRESSGPLTAVYRVAAGHVSPDHWVHDLAEGGGRILGEACHFVDSFRFLAASQIVEVHAVAHGDPRLALQARDNVIVTLLCADESIGSLVYSSDFAASTPKERLEASRAGRTAVVDDYRVLELYSPTGRDRQRSSQQDKGHHAEVAAFLAGTARGVPPVPLTEVANVSLATLAIVESLRTGLPVALHSADDSQIGDLTTRRSSIVRT